MLRYFFIYYVSVKSSRTLFWIYVPSLEKVQVCRKIDSTFLIPETIPRHPRIWSLRFQRQLWLEEEAHVDKTSSAVCTMKRCFFPNIVQQTMPLWTKDDCIPQIVLEACNIPAWKSTIYRDYDPLVEWETWKYIHCTSFMCSLPFTWKFWVKDHLWWRGNDVQCIILSL